MAALLPALQNSEHDRIESCFVEARTNDAPPTCLRDAAVAIAPYVLAPAWRGLDEMERARFHEALASAMHRELLGVF